MDLGTAQCEEIVPFSLCFSLPVVSQLRCKLKKGGRRCYKALDAVVDGLPSDGAVAEGLLLPIATLFYPFFFILETDIVFY